MTDRVNVRDRRGLSLIEMMVVVAIIGVLIALLIPAIQAVRNSAKKVQNQNNMRQILTAIHTYASQNDGKLPNAGGWPGEICHNNNPPYGNPATIYTYTGTQYKADWTQTATGCASSDLISQVQSTWTPTGPQAWQGTWSTPTLTYNPANTRIDWTEGTPFFMLFPYMDYKNVWDLSYGPMSTGTQYKAGQPGAWVCDQTQCCDGDGGSWCSHYIWEPMNLYDASTLVVSKVNYGWQGGRAPTLLKSFVGSGDPTADFPGMLAPLSYPMMSNFTGNIESYNTAYQGMITEAYAGCGSGTYNSWAASQYINIDFLPIPLTPAYSNAAGGVLTGTGTKQYWTGVTTGDTQCEKLTQIYYDHYWSYRYDNAFLNSLKTACQCSGINKEQAFQDLQNSGVKAVNGVVPPPCTSQNYNTIYGNGQWMAAIWDYGLSTSRSPPPYGKSRNGSSVSWYHVPSWTYNERTSGSDWCTNPQWAQYSADDAGCHVGEWSYTLTYPTRNKNFWLDHPSPNGCPTGVAMSMVPGSLNIGFMDGSVHSINKDISFNTWNAILNGQAATDDVDNW